MRPKLTRLLVILSLLFAIQPAWGQTSWKAGTATIEITPTVPIWMAGYAARVKPAEGTELPLFAKALALEDEQGRRAVMVTTDLLGFSARFADDVAELAGKESGLSRGQILFNASHTHSGPALFDVLRIAYDMSPEQAEAVRAYTDALKPKLSGLIKAAIADLQPARISWGKTTATFAVNRRVATARGFQIGVNRLGPVDHRVSFMAVDRENGAPLAVLFSYSCHCTTLGADNYRYHGDWAGIAQKQLESRLPGATALFLNGTSGDANPAPRGSYEQAERYGGELAEAILNSLNGPLEPVDGTLATSLDWTTLRFAAPPIRSELEAGTRSENPYIQKHSRHYLEVLNEEGAISRDYSYPIQALRLGKAFTLVALAGEVVVDYSIRLRREAGDPNLWVAGYSNDVSFYVPSRRILREGGYEAKDSMIYYGQPGPFEESVEDRIVSRAIDMVKALRAKEQP
jgi:hypothetical protein